jgi:gas vesicle protein
MYIRHFVCGLGVGMAAGLLFAPTRGARTRQLIARSADRSQAALRQKCAELSDAATEVIGRGAKAARVTAAGVAEAVGAGRQVLMG